MLFEHAWVRFVVASLLLAAYGAVETLSRLAAWRQRPPRVRRPRWSHFLGFASMVFFYGIIGREGRSLFEDRGNDVGVFLAFLAMSLRFMARRGSHAVRYPDLTARLLFFAALPIVTGSPSSFLFL